MKNDFLSDKQQGLLSTLIHVDSLCRDNGIVYFLAFGTALGAVRHGGFIPWDDDADICVPRSQFGKLCDLIETKLCANQRLCIEDTNQLACYSFENPTAQNGCKTCVARLTTNTPSGDRATLDFFAIEDVPKNKLLDIFHGLFCYYRGFVLACARDATGRDSILANKALATKQRRIRLMIAKFLRHSCDYYRIKAWKTYGKYLGSGAKEVTIITAAHKYFGEKLPLDVVYPAREINFEGRNFYVMNDTHYFLTQEYGDYMTPPAEGDRDVHLEVGGVEMTVKKKVLES